MLAEISQSLEDKYWAGHSWLMPVILVTWETEQEDHRLKGVGGGDTQPYLKKNTHQTDSSRRTHAYQA
jgi:hypothetical protein